MGTFSEISTKNLGLWGGGGGGGRGHILKVKFSTDKLHLCIVRC